ncbi:MAG: 1-deoxy-D-xylulose-5-phosphate synthase [Lachnospiraceae bacterium]|nr:1-deoxy-D-xylulose-5-phosphate synthase [Lachnospiraceae bacterium]
MILEYIEHPAQVKKLSIEELELLAIELRTFLIDKVSRTGGHLASSLGVVELTLALMYVLDLPEDKIIWDVGHQTYPYKVLTGRKKGFDHLREKGGMSGFPKRHESAYDSFDTGHSSTSISAGIGMAKARDLLGQKNKIVAVIGDGSLSGGMAYEALNNLSALKSQMIVIINDNNMSISESTGGLNDYLAKIRLNSGYNELKYGMKDSLAKMSGVGEKVDLAISKAKRGIKQIVLPTNLFEDFEVTYVGPMDGHNLHSLIETLGRAVKLNRPIVMHVKTEKGRGYEPARLSPTKFHGVEPFDIKTGMPLAEKKSKSYTDVFAKKMLELGAAHPELVAVTAAMKDGTGLSAFAKRYPDRFFDVGIAEEHAVTFAAGMAAGGLHPVVAIYSSFLQRAYDQLIHDVCLQQLPVIFAVDRAGLVGKDGPTHHGVFDLSFLTGIPGMTVIAPKNRYELRAALDYAVELKTPVAIRYPRGIAWKGMREHNTPMKTGKSEVLIEGSEVVMLAVGSMVETAVKAAELLSEQGIDCSVINVRFVKPMDTELILKYARSHDLLVTLEDNVITGGFGQQVDSLLEEAQVDCDCLNIAIPDKFVEHGTVAELWESLEMDAHSVCLRILNRLKG